MVQKIVVDDHIVPLWDRIALYDSRDFFGQFVLVEVQARTNLNDFVYATAMVRSGFLSQFILKLYLAGLPLYSECHLAPKIEVFKLTYKTETPKSSSLRIIRVF